MAAIILLGLWVLLTEPSAYTRDPPTSTWTLKDLMAALDDRAVRDAGIESATVPARVKDQADDSARHARGHFPDGRDLRGGLGHRDHADPQAQLAHSTRRSSTCSIVTWGTPTGSGSLFVVVSGLGA
jgi:hypothetical protein